MGYHFPTVWVLYGSLDVDAEWIVVMGDVSTVIVMYSAVGVDSPCLPLYPHLI